MTVSRGYLYAAFIVFALLTEFYYITVFGGVLRPYHLLAPLIVLFGAARWPNLMSAPLFLLLAGLIFVNVVAALLATDPIRALLSLGLLLANVMLAVAVAILLISKRVSGRQVVMSFVFVAAISAVWTAAQVIAFSLMGMNLGLSESQQYQVANGWGPGFRTEANTFAKFLNVAFLLTFPTLFREVRGVKLILLMGLFAAGLVFAFTRSVLYTLPVTLVVIYLWYQKTGEGRPLTKKPFLLAAAFSSVVATYVMLSAYFNSYATHKIANFFNPNEIISGDSSGFRLMLQSLLIDSIFESPKNFIFGTGWGQVYYYLEAANLHLQPGGADIIVFTAYGGVFSGILWLAAVISAVRSAAFMSSAAQSVDERLFFQGVLFAILGLLITGLVNSSLIAPEYWIVFGLAIFSSYRAAAHRRMLKRTRDARRQSPRLQGVWQHHSRYA